MTGGCALVIDMGLTRTRNFVCTVDHDQHLKREEYYPIGHQVTLMMKLMMPIVYLVVALQNESENENDAVE